MALSNGRYHSFVLRVLSRDGSVISGEITHIGTRRTMRFSDWQRALDFVADTVKTGSSEDTAQRVAEEIQ